MASDEVLCETFESIDRVRGEISLSYFEFAALAALVIFKHRAVDVAILEIGLGGRLDAMNIVDPDVSIITQIALDHESWLGDNLEKIAVEKAGVMRSGKVCVVSDASPPESIYSCAADQESELLLLGKDFGIADGRAWYTLNRGEVIDMKYSASGHLPLPSAAAAMQALVSAGLRPDESCLEKVLRSTRLPGRLQWLDADKRILLDVAHNPNAAGYLKTYLQSIPGIKQVHAVVGMYGDKDSETVFSILGSCINHWYVTDMEDARGASAEELKRHLSHQAVCAVNTYDKIALAYGSAVEMAGEADLVLVFGSFPVVAEVLELTGHKTSFLNTSSRNKSKEH
jgi:dihydrofolate synthase/folylpolyglutamate synthase